MGNQAIFKHLIQRTGMHASPLTVAASWADEAEIQLSLVEYNLHFELRVDHSSVMCN